MKKKSLLVTLGCLVAFGLTACGSKQPEINGDTISENGQEAPQEIENPVELEEVEPTQGEDQGEVEEENIVLGDYAQLNILPVGVEYFSYWDTYNDVYVNFSSPRFFVKDGAGTGQKRMEQVFEELNNREAEYIAGEIEWYRDTIDNGYEAERYYVESKVQVLRADTIFSYVCRYQNAYMDEDTWTYSAYNYHTETGNEVQLQDWLKKDQAENFANLVLDQLQDLTDAQKTATRDVIIQNASGEEFDEYLNWALGDDGITVFVTPAVQKDEKAQLHIVFVPYQGNESVLSNMFYGTATGGNWMSPLFENVVYSGDYDGDGTLESLKVFAQEVDPENYRICPSVEYLGKDYKLTELGGYSYEAYINKQGDCSYLFVKSISDNDYAQMAIYKLTEDGLVQTEEVGNYSPAQISCLYDEDMYTEAGHYAYDDIMFLTNIDSLCLSSRTDLISTIPGYKTYALTADGTLETKDDRYTLGNQRMMQAKCDIAATVVEDGSALVIPAGCPLLYMATNGMDLAFFYMPDPTGETEAIEVMVEVDATGWPIKIGGMELEEVLEGVFFAG